MRTYSLSAVLVLCLAAISSPGITTHIIVQNTNDSGPGSLRQAINDSTSGGTIAFTNTVFATPQTIILSTTNDGTFGASALVITKPLYILGPASPNAVTLGVSPATPMRLLFVAPTGNLVLSNIGLAGGLAFGNTGGNAGQRGGCGGGGAGLGGAILNQGSVALVNCSLAVNEAVGGAGGGGIGGGLGSGAGGGGLGGAGTNGGNAFIGGIGGVPNGGPGGTNEDSGTSGGVGGGGGGGGSSFASHGGTVTTGFGGAGGAGGFGGGGGGGGAYDTEGFGGNVGGAGGNGGFGGGGGGGGAGTPDGAVGLGGFGGGNGGTSINTGNIGTAGGGGAGFGGAIFNHGGTLTITNCVFSQNSAMSGAGGQYGLTPGGNGAAYGGAIFNRNGSVIISGGTFAYNVGGDLYNLGDGAGQVARVTLLGATPLISNNAINGGATLTLPPPIPMISSAARLPGGKFQFSFTNLSGTDFTVIASTNLSAPAADWISLGAPTQAVGNLYQFTDPTPSNANYFYQLRFP